MCNSPGVLSYIGAGCERAGIRPTCISAYQSRPPGPSPAGHLRSHSQAASLNSSGAPWPEAGPLGLPERLRLAIQRDCPADLQSISSRITSARRYRPGLLPAGLTRCALDLTLGLRRGLAGQLRARRRKLALHLGQFPTRRLHPAIKLGELAVARRHVVRHRRELRLSRGVLASHLLHVARQLVPARGQLRDLLLELGARLPESVLLGPEGRNLALGCGLRLPRLLKLLLNCSDLARHGAPIRRELGDRLLKLPGALRELLAFGLGVGQVS